MDAEQLKELQKLVRTFGTYKVVSVIADMASEAVQDYKNNPDAVIHRDLPVVRNAVEQMKQNHEIRRFD
jgi:hypothetical protein